MSSRSGHLAGTLYSGRVGKLQAYDPLNIAYRLVDICTRMVIIFALISQLNRFAAAKVHEPQIALFVFQTPVERP
ncbi:MAG: hypothetical protein AAGL17_25930 [Cyanobacteria bacterium J06576_12]